MSESEIPDTELPGMWERGDFVGGAPDVVRSAPPPSAAVPEPADVEKVAAEIAHHVSPVIGRWRYADLIGREFDRDELKRAYRAAAAAALAVVRPSPDSEAVARVEALADRYEATSKRRRQLAEKWQEAGRWETADAFRNLARESDVAADRIRAALGTGAEDAR